jgi:hypothetical protein
MVSDDEHVPIGPKRRYDRAPASVKVAVSLIYVQMVLLGIGALAVNVTLARTPAGESGRWPWTMAVLGLAVGYGFLAYRLLQGREWARVATMGVSLVTVGLLVLFFQPVFCFLIMFALIVVAGLMTREARSFFTHGLPDA